VVQEGEVTPETVQQVLLEPQIEAAVVVVELLITQHILPAAQAALVLSSSDTYLQDNRLLIHLQRPVL
jgi:hypothetical protein